MIRTQEEYNNACNFIDSDMELYDFQLSEKMSSYEYNLYLQDTEYFLNFLYEKIRTLEELCDYLDKYIDIKIKNAEKEIEQKISILEKTVAMCATNNERISIPSWDSSVEIQDRDGSIISTVMLRNDGIEGAYKKTNLIQPISIQQTGGQIPFASSFFIEDTATYLSRHQEVENKDAREKLRIFLPNKEYNCIEYTPINADIQLESLENQYVDVTIKSLSYQKKQVPFNYDEYKKQSLDKIKKVDINHQDTTTTVTNRINTAIEKQNKENILYYQDQIKKYQDQTFLNNNKSEIVSVYQ